MKPNTEKIYWKNEEKNKFIFKQSLDDFVSYSLTDSSGVATVTSESNGHTQNGDTEQNGIANTLPNERIQLDKTDQDIVRLIGQHLKIVGLE